MKPSRDKGSIDTISSGGKLEQRLLVLAATKKDGEVASRVLVQTGMDCHVCGSPSDMMKELDRGAGALLLAEEVLKPETLQKLSEALSRQPPWSDIPILVLTHHGANSPLIHNAMEHLGNIQVMERPVRVATLTSVARAALKSRERQYLVRDTQQQLRESKERYRGLFTNMMEGFALCEVIFDDAGKPVNYRFLDVNEGLTRQSGMPRERLLGKLATDAFPKLEPVWMERFIQVGVTGEPQRISEYNADTGRYYDVNCYSPSYGRFVFLARDVTQEHRAEQALRESEAQFRTLAESLPQLIWMTKADGYLEYFNQRWYDYTGTTPEENKGDLWTRVLHPDDFQRTVDAWQLSVRTGYPYNVEYRLRNREGIYRWFLARGLPLRNQDGQITRWFGSSTDVHEQKQSEQAIRASEKRYRTLFEHSPDAIFLTVVDGSILEANPAACAMLGMSQAEIIGRGRDSIVEESPAVLDFMRKREQTGSATTAEFTFMRKDGTRFPAEVSSTLLSDDPSGRRALVIARDITERKKAEEELRLAAAVYQDSSEAMMVTDEINTIIAVNQAFTEMTGYQPNEVIGKDPRILKSGQHDLFFYKDMWGQIISTGRYKGELWNKKKNGEFFAVQLTVNAIKKDDGSAHRYVGLLSDITEKKRSDDVIWVQANFDALTGLPNRRLFRDRLQHEVRNAKRSRLPLALMYLDLDGFKDVNDTLGHDMGDVLLREAAHRLQHCVRDSDSVARLGGDEFTVILTELHDTRNVDRVAQHILATLSQPFDLSGEAAHVSASIGITFYPQDAEDVETLLRNADQAMYAAKQEGKNQYHYFTQQMQDAAMARMHLINDLRSALDSNQFEIAYQPIVDLSSGVIQKAEALIRWQHPKKGLINPIEFISAAEDTGMITSFGNWVFHEAARQVALWREKYHPAFQISVNISPVQFRKEGIDPAIWLEHLKKLELPGQGIVVEITEGLLLDASPKVTDQLLMLRDAGIEVSLDDFGTGYSSLAYLQKFDIDYIKIDQAFVKNLRTDSEDSALCKAMIVMAHKLDIKVIAEGVEVQRQHELLANYGCDFAQGYYFSRPVSAAEFEQLLDTNPFVSQESFNM